jgi:hypothetical protein
MYTAVIHEGEIVQTPTGRHWVVVGWSIKHTRVELHDPLTDEDCSLPPSMLRHVTSEFAGARLPTIAIEELRNGIENAVGQ